MKLRKHVLGGASIRRGLMTMLVAGEYSTDELSMRPLKELPAKGYLDWKAEQDKEAGSGSKMIERSREVSDALRGQMKEVVALDDDSSFSKPELDPIQQIRERNRLAEEQVKARQDRIDKMDPIDRARRGLETKGRIII